jgi:hypothetical protein
MFEALPFKCRRTSKKGTLGVFLHGAMLGLQDRDADGFVDSGRENFERRIDGILRGDETDRFDCCERQIWEVVACFIGFSPL